MKRVALFLIFDRRTIQHVGTLLSSTTQFILEKFGSYQKNSFPLEIPAWQIESGCGENHQLTVR